MFGIFLALFLAVLLVGIVRFVQEPEDENPVLFVLLAGYILRFLIRTFNRNLVVFSDGQTLGGGDAVTYETRANWVIQAWDNLGMHFVTNKEIPEFYDVSLPPNLFGLIGYVNKGYTAIGYLSIIAFSACLTALVLYRTYIVFDSERKVSFYSMCAMLFCPSFVVFTSDSFKEGLLIFFVISIFSIFVHLNRRNFYFLIPCLIFCFIGLEGTRFYLVYALLPSSLIFLFWLQQRKALSLDIGLLFFCVFLFVIYCGWHEVLHAFNIGYSKEALVSNIGGASGIDVDAGKPTILGLPIKILYSILAPFPWQSGSFGLHLAKIEMLFWYFVLYWFCRGTWIFSKRDPVMVLIFLVFIVGMTVVYAWSFANIGLMYRQRLVLFFVASILAVWGKVATKQKI